MAKPPPQKKIPQFEYACEASIHTYRFPDAPVPDVRITIEGPEYDKFHRLQSTVTGHIGDLDISPSRFDLLNAKERVNFESVAAELDGQVPWHVFLLVIVPHLLEQLALIEEHTRQEISQKRQDPQPVHDPSGNQGEAPQQWQARREKGSRRRPTSNAATHEVGNVNKRDEDDNHGLPRIDADNEDVPEIAAQAWKAMLAANDPPVIFRQGTLIRLEHDVKTGVHAVEVNAHRWRHHLARAAHFYRSDAKGNDEPALPPTWLVEDMLARPESPLPPLSRIVEVPVFAEDGTLQTTPGYHPASATFLALPKGLVIPEVPEMPTADDVHFARLLIEEITVDFPFSHDAPHDDDRFENPQFQANLAHAYALFLLPFVRDLIDDPTPAHLIESSAAGSGKGLLAHALLRVSMGHHLGVLTEAREEDEWRKRLTTVFKEVRSAVLVDNLRRPLDSGQVAAALTAWYWEDRKLGTNETIRVPIRCVWCMTGNNPVLSTEIARRTIRIRLDPRMDRPWLRTGFRHADLLGWVTANRSRLVWAALVLIKNWLAQGRPAPEGLTPLGSYEQWSTVIGGILAAAKVPGFLSNLEEFYELADHEGAVLRAFIGLWWEKFQSQEVGAMELLPLAQEVDGLDLRGKDELGLRRSLGKLLAKQRDRVIGSARICMAGTLNRATRWKLINLPQRQS